MLPPPPPLPLQRVWHKELDSQIHELPTGRSILLDNKVEIILESSIVCAWLDGEMMEKILSARLITVTTATKTVLRLTIGAPSNNHNNIVVKVIPEIFSNHKI